MSKKLENMNQEELKEYEKQQEANFRKQSASIKYLRAIEYHSRNEFEKAVYAYREALKLDADNSTYKFALKDALNKKPHIN